MGTKTSVYLSDELAAAWRASGVPLSEIVRRGLDCKPEPLEELVRRVIREELAAIRPGSDEQEPRCTHPKARVNKGLCGACGTYVGTTRGGQ